MPFETVKPYIVDDFQGMIQRQDPDKIPENFSPLLVNISLDKPGTWMKRKGTDLLATTQAGNGVYGLIDYKKNDSTTAIRAVRSRDLDRYTEDTDTYTQLQSNAFTASTIVSSTNFNNFVYHISPNDYFSKESGTVLAVVGTGDDRIKANQLVTAQNTIFVCGVTTIGSSAVEYQDRVYYSFFDTDNNVPSDQLWTDSEGNLASSTRFFSIEGPHKASFSYNGFSYHFTNTKCWEFDIGTTQLREVFNIGCAGTRAITECNGWMIWMAPDGRLFGWGGAGPPIPLSWAIEDDANEEAIINVVAKSEIPNVSMGSVGSKFWVSVGDVTTMNETITNACIVGLITQNLENVLWTVESFPVKPQIFAKAMLNDKEVLLFGAEGVDDVYEMNTGTDDVGSSTTAITSIAKMSFLDFKKPFDTKNFNRLYIKYRPQPASETYLKVQYAINGDMAYSTLSDPDGATAVTKHGRIDMYSASATTDRTETGILEFPQEAKGELLSIELSNSQQGERFEIDGIGIMYEEESVINKRVY